MFYFDHRIGIQVLGISSDGDSRLLSAMKNNMDFKPTVMGDHIFFSINEILYIQDTTHIGTKLRNRLLKASILLPFGNKAISISHLKQLLKLAPKDVHGLVRSDISPDDRQNFKSLQKLMENRVVEALKKYVIDSEATIVYLQMCKNITSSFLEEKLTPDERVYKMWHSVFLLRIWRNFLSRSNMYNVNENFISSNAFNCIELNAMGLVQLIVTLRDSGKPDMFLPTLLDSQVCESTFRQMRSMTTMNWTKINFNLMELLHMVSRVELQNDVMYKLTNFMEFPRSGLRVCSVETPHHLPSNKDIELVIQRALGDAIQCASTFGMTCEKSDLHECQLKIRVVKKRDLEEEHSSESEPENSLTNRENINLRDYSGENIAADGNSKYIEICDVEGTTKLVLKSSIVWLLSENPKKLSNDRLKRVQTLSVEQASKRKKIGEENIRENIDITIGDWCFFKIDSDMSKSFPERIIRNIIFGSVLAFKYIELDIEGKKARKKEKSKQYFYDTASVADDVEVLSSWYFVRDDGVLLTLGTESNFFVDIKNFIAKTKSPMFILNEGSVDLTCLPENIKDKIAKQRLLP